MKIIDLRNTWKSIFVIMLLVGFVALAWQWTARVGAQQSNVTPRFCTDLPGDRTPGDFELIAYRLYGWGLDQQDQLLKFVEFRQVGETIVHVTNPIDNNSDSNDPYYTGGYMVAEAEILNDEGRSCFDSEIDIDLSNFDTHQYHIAFVKGEDTDYLTTYAKIPRGEYIEDKYEINLNIPFYEGDANGDNNINLIDVSILVSSYNPNSPLCEGSNNYQSRADFNEDGCVDSVDDGLLSSNLTPPFYKKGAGGVNPNCPAFASICPSPAGYPIRPGNYN